MHASGFKSVARLTCTLELTLCYQQDHSSSSIEMKQCFGRFMANVNFFKNNQMITVSRIQKFSARVTMNEVLINSGVPYFL